MTTGIRCPTAAATCRSRSRPGCQKMDGERALEYARTRHQDADYGRMRRQQIVLVAARAPARPDHPAAARAGPARRSRATTCGRRSSRTRSRTLRSSRRASTRTTSIRSSSTRRSTPSPSGPRTSSGSERVVRTIFDSRPPHPRHRHRPPPRRSPAPPRDARLRSVRRADVRLLRHPDRLGDRAAGRAASAARGPRRRGARRSDPRGFARHESEIEAGSYSALSRGARRRPRGDARPLRRDGAPEELARLRRLGGGLAGLRRFGGGAGEAARAVLARGDHELRRRPVRGLRGRASVCRSTGSSRRSRRGGTSRTRAASSWRSSGSRCRPSRILHVAQSLYHDHVPAKRLGLSTVWVDRRGGRAGSGATPPAQATPDLIVPDMATLAALAVPS